MRKILYVLLFLTPFFAVGQNTKVTAPIDRNDPRDTTYASHKDTVGLGGRMSFSSIANRDALPRANRRPGMQAAIYFGSGIITDSIVTYTLARDSVTWIREYAVTAAGGGGIGGDFIRNQFAGPQSANAWVSGTIQSNIMYSNAIGNPGGANNANLNLSSNGPVLSRNINDLGVSGIVQNLNAGTSGDAFQVKQQSDTNFRVTKTGMVESQARTLAAPGGATNPAFYAMPNYDRSGPASAITNFNSTDGTPGTYTGISPTPVATSGSGLIISISVASTGQFIATTTVTTPGTGYKVGDRFTIPRSAIGSPTAGTYTLFIGEVVNSNGFSVNNSPLLIETYPLKMYSTGAFTPFVRGRLLDRSNNSLYNFDFGNYYTDNVNSYMSFRINDIYTLGMQAGSVNIPSLTATTLTAGTSTFNFITHGGATTNTGSTNTQSMYVDQLTRYAPSRSFINSGAIPGGSVQSIAIVNGGSGYTPGTYTNISTSATSGSGSGLIVDVTVNGSGVVSSVIRTGGPASYGSGYANSDLITASIPGGSGFSGSVTLRTGGQFPVYLSNRTVVGNPGDQHISFQSADVITGSVAAGTNNNAHRGLYVNPTLTNISNFRGVETLVNSGQGYQLFIGGTAQNYIKGPTNVDSIWFFNSGFVATNSIRTNALARQNESQSFFINPPNGGAGNLQYHLQIQAPLRRTVTSALIAGTLLVDSTQFNSNTTGAGYSQILLNPWIDQTGFSGATRGIYVNPLGLINVSNYRAIQTNVASANGYQFFAEGTAPSQFNGDVNGVDPASNDSTTKFPTTRWVKQRIAAGGGTQNLNQVLSNGNTTTNDIILTGAANSINVQSSTQALSLTQNGGTRITNRSLLTNTDTTIVFNQSSNSAGGRIVLGGSNYVGVQDDGINKLQVRGNIEVDTFTIKMKTQPPGTKDRTGATTDFVTSALQKAGGADSIFRRSITTTDASQTTIASFNIQNGANYTLSFTISGKKNGTQNASYGYRVVFGHDGTNAQVLDGGLSESFSPIVTSDLLSTSVSVATSGSLAGINVTGVASTTINWIITCSIIKNP